MLALMRQAAPPRDPGSVPFPAGAPKRAARCRAGRRHPKMDITGTRAGRNPTGSSRRWKAEASHRSAPGVCPEPKFAPAEAGAYLLGVSDVKERPRALFSVGHRSYRPPVWGQCTDRANAARETPGPCGSGVLSGGGSCRRDVPAEVCGEGASFGTSLEEPGLSSGSRGLRGFWEHRHRFRW